MSQVDLRILTMLERLELGHVLVSDGATGTYLQTKGLEPGGCPEAFNTSHPEIVKDMAKDYFDVGSDIVLTNSFGGSQMMLEKYGLGGQVKELNRLAVQHARSSAPQGRYVLGSVGPTGEFLEPLGDISEVKMMAILVEQVTSLEEGGADGVLIETMTALEEMTLAIKAVKENTKLPVLATMTFDKGPRGFFTMMGVSPEQAVCTLQEAGADVVGSNCGNGIENMWEIAKKMRELTDGFLIINSNAGIPEIKKGQVIYTESPEFMSQYFKQMADIGVNILGGCCGSTPSHIRALVKAVRD